MGVLGGMGPHATVDFFGLLVRLTPADKDWNHLHIIVDNNPRIPSRTRAYLYDEASPISYMIEGARRLEGMGAGVIVVPCNSASHFLADVRAAVKATVLDPVGSTSEHIVREGTTRRPLVLGGMVTHRAELYAHALAARGVVPVRPTDTEQHEVAALIEALKKLDTSPAVVQRTLALIEAGMTRGADSAILGCTEFGLIADELARVARVPIYNSNELLARATLRLAWRE
ncbi:MAG: aspartate/glutamate racemase family protein [Kofleriaceae bacterium]